MRGLWGVLMIAEDDMVHWIAGKKRGVVAGREIGKGWSVGVVDVYP